MYDVVIAGGGPAGLSAALLLGRARKRVLLCDAGEPRNAAAEEVHGFVTRDGTPPREFRRIAREQLLPYESVEVRDGLVRNVAGTRGAFDAEIDGGSVQAKRILLATGMVDELSDLPGYRELWGTSVFQCPYCHGWEVRNRAFGYLAPAVKWLDFAIFLRGWTQDVVAFTDAKFEVPVEVRLRLEKARVELVERPIRRLARDGEHLKAVELADGARIPRDVLFVRPPQRQTDLVRQLGLTLDEQQFVVVNEQKETSTPGIHAAGDLTTQAQSATLAAAAGAQAASLLNHSLTMEAHA